MRIGFYYTVKKLSTRMYLKKIIFNKALQKYNLKKKIAG